METPARFTFAPDGNTKVFQIPVTMKGDNYVRIDIDSVTLNDRTKFDLVNNAVVFVSTATVPAGSQLDVLVVQTDEGISNLGSITAIDTVSQNITDVNTVATNITSVNTTATNIASVNNVSTNMAVVVDAVNQATAAAASAAAALVSENAAEASETAAGASEAAAATSETNAATSASNSASSASAANTSATAAAGSATAAATSATNAATSATASSGSASAAAASATAAATSETNAAASEANAATSETNAATSETNAANSATAAAASETNAATSAAAASNSQIAAAASAAAAANVYDTFDDRYLGAKSADPTLDNDGNPLIVGSLYFNNAANEMRVYDGGNWVAASSAGGVSLLQYEFTATEGQTVFSGTDGNGNSFSYTQNNIIVFLNGVALDDGADYAATNGTSIVLTSGATAGDLLYIIAFKPFTSADMVSASNGGTFYNDITIQGNLSITGTVDGVDISGLASVATSGDYNDLINTPSPFDPNTLATVATTGSYTDLINIPANIVTDAAYVHTDNNYTTAEQSKLAGIEAGATADQTITAGSGLTGGGTGDVTISHADTSSQGSVNNSGSVYIQDITLDTYGHVTGITSTTVPASAPSNNMTLLGSHSGNSAVTFSGLNLTPYNFLWIAAQWSTNSAASEYRLNGTFIGNNSNDSPYSAAHLSLIPIGGRGWFGLSAYTDTFVRNLNQTALITTSTTSLAFTVDTGTWDLHILYVYGVH